MGYCLLSAFYLFSLAVLWRVARCAYQRQGFSFHLLFSALYGITFYFGFPFSMALKFGFNVALPPLESQFYALLSALLGYLIYAFVYLQAVGSCQKFANYPQAVVSAHFFAKNTAKLTACLLLGLALSALLAFVWFNGWLLFRLEKYSQIFSPLVQGVALKRFFYFALAGLLIFYLLKPSRARWWQFLGLAVAFGILSYLATGGTRANLALAVGFFFLIGVWQRYLAWRWVWLAGGVSVLAMFGLAWARYKLQLNGEDALYTFLYLSRDTFSPWENLALLFSKPVEFQGLMPIVRDFYVYIPKSLWADRPDIAWNSANYFTKVLLGNESGLAISPTLLGSFYIMGGVPLMALGMAAVGVIIRLFDGFFARAGVIGQAYCFANLFNLMVLAREGLDGFVSRWLFFSVVFGACWLMAKGITKCLRK